MKKTILLLLVCLLMGCGSKQSNVKPVILFKDIDEEEEVAVAYIEEETLTALVKTLNSTLQVVELDSHHTQLKAELLVALDKNKPVDDQIEIIESVTLSYLETWQENTIKNLLIEEKISINEEDFQSLIDRTSILSAYTLMVAYETVYLNKHFK